MPQAVLVVSQPQGTAFTLSSMWIVPSGFLETSKNLYPGFCYILNYSPWSCATWYPWSQEKIHMPKGKAFHKSLMISREKKKSLQRKKDCREEKMFQWEEKPRNFDFCLYFWLWEPTSGNYEVQIKLYSVEISLSYSNIRNIGHIFSVVSVFLLWIKVIPKGEKYNKITCLFFPFLSNNFSFVLLKQKKKVDAHSRWCNWVHFYK